MQHIERVPQPHRGVHLSPPAVFAVLLIVIIAVVAGALYLDRQELPVTAAASWSNEQLLATNPELKAVLGFEDARSPKFGLAYVEQNPELILMRGYGQATIATYDDAFLAVNPEFKVQRRYLDSTGQ